MPDYDGIMTKGRFNSFQPSKPDDNLGKKKATINAINWRPSSTALRRVGLLTHHINEGAF